MEHCILFPCEPETRIVNIILYLTGVIRLEVPAPPVWVVYSLFVTRSKSPGFLQGGRSSIQPPLSLTAPQENQGLLASGWGFGLNLKGGSETRESFFSLSHLSFFRCRLRSIGGQHQRWRHVGNVPREHTGAALPSAGIEPVNEHAETLVKREERPQNKAGGKCEGSAQSWRVQERDDRS